MNNDLTKTFEQLILSTGELLNREGLRKTPARAASAFQYLTSGYRIDIKELINDAIFECENNEMVIVKNIEFFSLCEHHLLPMIGKCHVAYIPNGKVLGLSKIARIVDVFSRRLQIQETLTKQIAETICEVVEAQGVMVIADAVHLCMMARGVSKQHSSVRSMSTLGNFQTNVELKNHFINSLNIKNEN